MKNVHILFTLNGFPSSYIGKYSKILEYPNICHTLVSQPLENHVPFGSKLPHLSFLVW